MGRFVVVCLLAAGCALTTAARTSAHFDASGRYTHRSCPGSASNRSDPVNVVFHGGADFDEPPPLGDTGRSRYVKVTSLDEAKRPEVRRWIEQAGRVPGWQ